MTTEAPLSFAWWAHRPVLEATTRLGSFATGSVPVELRTPTDFAVRFSQAVSLDAKVYVLSRLVLAAEGELGRDGLAAGGSSEYSAARIGVGIRY